MKRFLLASDTHGRDLYLRKVIERNLPLSGFIFCGDGEGLENSAAGLFGESCPLFMVCGNNDFSSKLPKELVFQLGNRRIYLTHGHRLGVSYTLEHLAEKAASYGCDTAFFGHTHVPEKREVDGVLCVNPGSISLPRQYPAFPSYMLIDLDERGDLHFQQAYLRERKGRLSLF